MMKHLKKTLAVLLCVVMMLGIAPLNGLTELELPELHLSALNLHLPKIDFNLPEIHLNLPKISLPGFSSMFATKAEAANPTSGTCGDNLTWIYDQTADTLIISGTGAMSSYSIRDYVIPTAPWGHYYNTMKSAVIESGVTSIGEYAFFRCTELTNITIPNSVTSIGDYAFYYCTGLTSIAIPNSVTSIGKSVFKDCTGLTSIAIPNSVTSIGDGALSYCDGLASITVSDNNSFYHSAGNCLIEKESKTLIAGCKNSIIPNDGSATSIGDNAFYGCIGLTSISIPNSVTSIGNNAFYYCTGLTNISISNSATSIGDRALSYCDGLTSITIPDSITSIGDGLFLCCHGLASVTIPNSVTSIGDGAFCCCDGLTSINIPNSVTSIDDYAFDGCTSLISINIPDGVTKIGDSAFKDCRGLTSINIPESVTSIGRSVFDNCGLTSITIPNSVTSIGNYAFRWCSLTSISIPSSVTSIGDGAFYACVELTSITISKNVTSIGDNAFFGCNKTITVTVPASVQYIGSKAFYNVTNLAYRGKATGSPWGAKCVNGFADGYLVYSDSAKSELVACSGIATGSVIIPASTYTIGEYAFKDCSTLTAVFVPVKVKRIGTRAFQDTALTDVYYEGGANEKLVLLIDSNNASVNNATWHYNSSVSDMPQTAVYTLTYNANGGTGAPASQNGNGNIILSSTRPTRDGYTFLGWATTANSTSAQYGAGSLINLDKNTTLYAVWQKENTPNNPDNPPSADISEANIIKGNTSNNQTTYGYRTTITFTANVPSGGKVQWYVDGKKAGTDSTLTIKDSTSSFKVTVVVTDKNGNQTKDEEEVTIKNGFFDKLIWFFVHLFNPGAYDVKQ